MGRLGGKATAGARTPEQRSAAARHAVSCRWHREMKAAKALLHPVTTPPPAGRQIVDEPAPDVAPMPGQLEYYATLHPRLRRYLRK